MHEIGLFAGTLLAAILLATLALYRIIHRTRVAVASPALWKDRSMRCPQCTETMQQGYVMAGRGLIWRSIQDRPIGSFAHIGQALDNTLSFSLPPKLNMAWHCEQCRLILVDHAKMIKC